MNPLWSSDLNQMIRYTHSEVLIWIVIHEPALKSQSKMIRNPSPKYRS